MKIHTALFVAALPALLAAPATAQDADNGKFVVAAGEVQLDDLVNQAAEYLGVNILMSPQEWGGALPIRLHKAIETDRAGCQEVVANLLYRSGYALTVMDDEHDLYEAIMMTGQRGREITNRAERKTVEQILARPRLAMPVMTTVQLEHVNAQLANNALRPFFAASSNGNSLTIGNVGNQSSLILAGMQNQVAHAIKLIQSCDVPRREPDEADPVWQRVKRLEERIEALEQRAGRAGQQGK